MKPTLAGDALFWHRGGRRISAAGLDRFTDKVAEFAKGDYKKAKDMYPDGDPDFLKGVLVQLSEYLRIPPEVLRSWKLDPATPDVTRFLTSLFPICHCLPPYHGDANQRVGALPDPSPFRVRLHLNAKQPWMIA
jgi:hypothetical protein